MRNDDIEEYVKTGKLVGGIELVEGDLQVERHIEFPAGHETQYTTHTDNEVVVRLGTKAYPESTSEWLVQGVINRVQKPGKKGGLQATEVYYKFEDASRTEIIMGMEQYNRKAGRL